MSVVDLPTLREVRRVKLGPYPRGIAVDGKARAAFVAVMGSSDIARVDLNDFSVTWIRDDGRYPRHVVLDPGGRYLDATLDGGRAVVKVDVERRRVVARAKLGRNHGSMAMS